MVRETTCEQCGARVAECDNRVLLDLPAVEYDPDPLGACWTIMQLGETSLGSVGSPGTAIGGGPAVGHTLHEHQPEGAQ